MSVFVDTSALLAILDENAYALHARQVTDDLGIHPTNRSKLARPVGSLVRPRQPGSLMRLPLGGHPAATIRGSGAGGFARVRRWSHPSHLSNIGP